MRDTLFAHPVTLKNKTANTSNDIFRFDLFASNQFDAPAENIMPEYVWQIESTGIGGDGAGIVLEEISRDPKPFYIYV